MFFIIASAVNWKQYIESEKIELLTKIKEIIKKKSIDSEFVDFSLVNVKWLFKELYRNDTYKFRVWLDESDESDFWRFYIYTTSYEKLPKNIKNNFIKEDWWDKWNYPYINSYDWMNQFEEILKILNIK